jgi:hypothetical protein
MKPSYKIMVRFYLQRDEIHSCINSIENDVQKKKINQLKHIFQKNINSF